MTAIRAAEVADLPAVLALLADDGVHAVRDPGDPAGYLADFAAMRAAGTTQLFVACDGGVVLGTYQLTLMTGLSLRASRRAEVEGVRVLASARRRGIGRLMMEDAVARARAAGCGLVQLTSNAERRYARGFYESLGFRATHLGFKMDLG